MQEISKCLCSGYALVRYFRNFQQASLKILFQSFSSQAEGAETSACPRT